MLRMIVAQLRGRPGRAVALLAGVVIATASFTVLTASAQTSRLQVIGTVDSSFGSADDILVRPRGARTATERDTGSVAELPRRHLRRHHPRPVAHYPAGPRYRHRRPGSHGRLRYAHSRVPHRPDGGTGPASQPGSAGRHGN